MKLRLGCWFLLATLCLLSPCVVAQSPEPAPSDSLLEARWAASTERMEDTVLGLDFRTLLVQRFAAARRIDIPLPKLQGMGDVLSVALHRPPGARVQQRFIATIPPARCTDSGG